MVAVTLDAEVLKVAEYVYKERLSKAYTEVGPHWEYNHKHPTATLATGTGHNLQRSVQIGSQLLHRPIHGLAHTMRTLMYSQVMYEAAKQQPSPHRCADGRTIADLSALDLKKLNIAQLFFVAGRESEASYGDAYHRYHLYGAQQFELYARKYLTHLFSEAEIVLYSRCIEDREGDRFDATPVGYLMHIAHMVDLMRCKSPVEVFIGHTRGVSGIVPTLIHLFGRKDGLDIVHYARNLFSATGEAVPYISSSEWAHLGIEPDRVEKALSLIGPLEVGGQEADVRRTAQAGFSVEGCYRALHAVATPEWYHEVKEPVQDKIVEVSPPVQRTQTKEETTQGKGFSLMQLFRWFTSHKQTDKDKASTPDDIKRCKM